MRKARQIQPFGRALRRLQHQPAAHQGQGVVVHRGLALGRAADVAQMAGAVRIGF